MNILDETWRVSTPGQSRAVWLVNDADQPDLAKFYSPARARLAAQAPAMARWLLKNVVGPNAQFACPTEIVDLARDILKAAGVLP